MENKKVTNKSYQVSYNQVWDALRSIDISDKIVQKMGLDYLGWADAWALFMQYYQQST